MGLNLAVETQTYYIVRVDDDRVLVFESKTKPDLDDLDCEVFLTWDEAWSYAESLRNEMPEY